jgi:hypothetical protein
VNEVRINNRVYNGRQKVNSNDKMFMDPMSVKKLVMSLKIKNSEGSDPIPQSVLADVVEILAPEFARLFKLINDQTVPAQRLVAKTFPISRIRASLRTLKVTGLLQIFARLQIF